MSFADEARLVLEARQLLARQRNKEAVITYYVNRGMAPDAAQEMIHSIYRENLTENRKSAYGWLIGGIAGIVVSVGFFFVGGWLTLLSLIAAPAALIVVCIGVGRLCVTRGYEMDDGS